jgi:hypothetical protein
VLDVWQNTQQRLCPGASAASCACCGQIARCSRRACNALGGSANCSDRTHCRPKSAMTLRHLSMPTTAAAAAISGLDASRFHQAAIILPILPISLLPYTNFQVHCRGAGNITAAAAAAVTWQLLRAATPWQLGCWRRWVQHPTQWTGSNARLWRCGGFKHATAGRLVCHTTACPGEDRSHILPLIMPAWPYRVVGKRGAPCAVLLYAVHCVQDAVCSSHVAFWQL